MDIFTNRQVIDQAKAHCCRCFHNEGVGFVVNGQFLPQENISSKPENTFELAREAWLKSGTVQAVIHSHPMQVGEEPVAYPSAYDMHHQIASAVPWAIMVCDAERAGDPIWLGDQAPISPLVGRPFRHGVTDCCNLIRDYYRSELGIRLKEFPRDWEWWLHGRDLYRDGFEQAGFRRVAEHEVKSGDVFLASLGRGTFRINNIPNHGGIYLGDSIFLHHLTGSKPVDFSRLSAREVGSRYLKYVTHWLRHEARNE